MIKIRTSSLLILAMLGLSSYAAAGFADAYHDRQVWIFPAYKYCLIFGLIILLTVFIFSLIWKRKVNEVTERTSTFLVKYPVVAIVVVGLLLAIPLVILQDLMWETLWFMSIFPVLGIIIGFPLLLTNKKIREKWLLSHFMIKWLTMIAIACVGSSFLFIVLTNCDLLAGTDITYLARPDRTHQNFYTPTHPYDSMIEIWESYIIFICDILISLILFGIGTLNRSLCKYLAAHRESKRAYV